MFRESQNWVGTQYSALSLPSRNGIVNIAFKKYVKPDIKVCYSCSNWLDSFTLVQIFYL